MSFLNLYGSQPTSVLTPKCCFRTKCNLQDQTRPSGMLIDVAKHVGNITYVVSKKLQANIRYGKY